MIKCAKCKNKIFKYNKIGAGRILKVHFGRIQKDYSKTFENNVLCSNCNNIIGFKEISYVKLIKESFTYTGHKIN